MLKKIVAQLKDMELGSVGIASIIFLVLLFFILAAGYLYFWYKGGKGTFEQKMTKRFGKLQRNLQSSVTDVVGPRRERMSSVESEASVRRQSYQY